MKSFWFPLALVVLMVGVGCGSPQPEPSTERYTEVIPGVESLYTKEMVRGVEWAVPKGMDIGRYPILPPRPNRRLTEAEVRDMGLHRETRPAGTVLWNEIPGSRHFALDTLRTTRGVWVNEAGEVVYIEDCANRAMDPMTPLSYPTDGPLYSRSVNDANGGGILGGGPVADNPSATDGNSAADGNGSWIPGWVRSFFGGIGTLLGGLFGILDDLLWLLLIIALGLMLIGAIVSLWEWLMRQLRGGTAPAAPVTPVAQVVPPTPGRRRHFGPRPAAAPAATPVAPPEPVATFRRFGPYDDVQVNNAGADGFQVTAYNGDQEIPLGVFQWAEVEPTPDGREFVIVQQ